MKRTVVLTGGNNIQKIAESIMRGTNAEVLIFDNYQKNIVKNCRTITMNELNAKKNDVEVVIANNSITSTYELCMQMKKNGIKYSFYDEKMYFRNILHIYGEIEIHKDGLKYEWMGLEDGVTLVHKQIEKMYKMMFDMYNKDFVGEDIDIYYYYEDMPQDAYKIAQIYDIPYVFSNCTTYAVSDRVVAIPNYFSCFDEKEYPWKNETQSSLRKAGERKWEYSQAFWKGDVENTPDDLRRMLFILGEKYQDYLRIENYRGFWNQVKTSDFTVEFTPMTDFAKYKYLIDIRGYSFGRMNRLLQLGRPVLRVESIYTEWFDKYLVPMKHFVPIKADLSDLIEKIELLNCREDIYEEIVNNAREFSEKYLKEESYLMNLKEITQKHICIKR